MKESCKESGNALIYVLIAIVLFAALSFTLSRQSGTGDMNELPDTRAELYATQIISYAAQVKSALDQMVFTGAKIDELDFTDPSDAAFNMGTQKARSNRVFHPEGGGITKGRLPPEAVREVLTDPSAGWYLGQFNNVEWTRSAADDVILVAYQIRREVCAKINEKINGSPVIPVLSDSIRAVMIDDSYYTGSNVELTTDATSGTPVCADCHEMRSLCVENQAQNAYGFYTIVLDQ
ncbi:MAG: hypothetical protein GW778_06555 [Alphaproteobacteria bacterium]|nr:hypothetical protein [Alphaproteobacteria bacterium]